MGRMDVLKGNFASAFPKWFQPMPGFKFRDGDDDPCIIIGWGGWRTVEFEVADTPFGRLVGSQFKSMPCSLVYSYNRNGEWHIGRISPAEQNVDNNNPKEWQAGWTKEQEKELSGWSG